MLVVIEGIVMCFVLLIVCVVGIANGPVGLVLLYEKDVQERVVKLGLTTKEKIKKKMQLRKNKKSKKAAVQSVQKKMVDIKEMEAEEKLNIEIQR